MKAKTVYETEDGKNFDNEDEAIKHEANCKINDLYKLNKGYGIGEFIIEFLDEIIKFFNLHKHEDYIKYGNDKYQEGVKNSRGHDRDTEYIKKIDEPLKPNTPWNNRPYSFQADGKDVLTVSSLEEQSKKENKKTQADRMFGGEYENSLHSGTDWEEK